MAEPVAVGFGGLLRQLRVEAQLTHEELAEKSGVAVRTISDLERGRSRIPHKTTARRLADALKLAGPARDAFEAAARGRLPGPDGPVVSRPAAPIRTLPRDIASFTGRKPQLLQVEAAAHEAADLAGVVRICAISGMAGVGKTALALRAARQVTSQFPDGQLFLDLHGHTDGLDPLGPAEALGTLLHSLGIPPQLVPEDGEARAAFYRSHLAGTRTLLVLDNASSAAQVEPLLPAAAGCLVLVTSRRRLAGLDDAISIDLDVLPETDAITLFGAIAGPGRVPADSPDLAEIVALCGYLPLAVRIIAARLSYRKSVCLEDLVEQLRHDRDSLTHLGDEDRNLTAVFDVSYRHLSAPEQHMFRHLAIIPGPDFDACAAANLADTDRAVAQRLLDSLLDHNLLIQRAASRYRFHDLVRAYARTLVSGPLTAPADRLLDYYLATTQSADRHFERRIPDVVEPAHVTAPRTSPRLDTLQSGREWMSTELANLDAAAQYAADHHRPGFVAALSGALVQYLRVHGPWTQAVAMNRRALRTAQHAGDLPGQAGALVHLGVMQRLIADFSQAEDNLTRALALFRELDDRQGQASTLAELGLTQRLTGDYAEADRALTQALSLYREVGNRHGEAGALAELGIVRRQRGQFSQADETLTEALGFYRELGNRYGEAGTLSYLGSVQWSAGNFAPANDTLQRALRLYRELDDRYGQANTLLYLGLVQQESGAATHASYALAKDTLTQARDRYVELGDQRGEAGALAYLGVVQTLTGDHAEADSALTDALNLFRKLHDRGGEAEALNHYAALASATSTPRQARAQYSEALHLAREISSAKDEADALAGIGITYRSEGNVTQARAHLLRALALYQSLGCTADAARVQAGLDSDQPR